jgi:hypothetical protein
MVQSCLHLISHLSLYCNCRGGTHGFVVPGPLYLRTELTDRVIPAEMARQHHWMAKWEGSRPVKGAVMKVCLDCGAELVTTWTETRGGRPTKGSKVLSIVYLPPCSGI